MVIRTFSVDTGNGNTVVSGALQVSGTTLSSIVCAAHSVLREPQHWAAHSLLRGHNTEQHTYREWCDDVEGATEVRNHFTVKNTDGNTNRFSVDTGNGNTVVGGTLQVSSGTTLSSTLSVNSTLGVTGATTLGSTLAVTGATTLSNTLTVNGATTLKGATEVKSFYSKEYKW